MKVRSQLSPSNAVLFIPCLRSGGWWCRRGLIPSVSPIVYITVPGATANSTSLQNPAAAVGRNKLLTDRFISLSFTVCQKTDNTSAMSCFLRSVPTLNKEQLWAGEAGHKISGLEEFQAASERDVALFLSRSRPQPRVLKAPRQDANSRPLNSDLCLTLC